MEHVKPREITKKQKRVFDFIMDYKNNKGWFPTIQEICDHFKFKSKNAGYDVVKVLEHKRYLKKIPSISRAFVILENGLSV